MMALISFKKLIDQRRKTAGEAIIKEAKRGDYSESQIKALEEINRISEVIIFDLDKDEIREAITEIKARISVFGRQKDGKLFPPFKAMVKRIRHTLNDLGHREFLKSLPLT
ncbi:MAG: hypothetical protein PHN74_02340 [Candidatus Pacebacteria bacterium]|nr:hypothetical protein [Candidatus Paceibacterota bacterium]